MEPDELVMGTDEATALVQRVLSQGYIQDGIGEDGEDIDPTPEVLAEYDRAIRRGDNAFVEWILDTYGRSYPVPILEADPYTILDEANWDILALLNEMEYVELPEVVQAILYDDPAYIDGKDLDLPLIRQVFKNNTKDIYDARQDEILIMMAQLRTENRYLYEELMSYTEK